MHTTTHGKLYLLAEVKPLPQYTDEVKAIFANALPHLSNEPGCEAMYTTSVADDPNTFIFFEIFSSEAAHAFHMEQDYTRKLAADLAGKLAQPLSMTRLLAL